MDEWYDNWLKGNDDDNIDVKIKYLDYIDSEYNVLVSNLKQFGIEEPSEELRFIKELAHDTGYVSHMEEYAKLLERELDKHNIKPHGKG